MTCCMILAHVLLTTKPQHKLNSHLTLGVCTNLHGVRLLCNMFAME